MSKNTTTTHIAFYLSEASGKFHLPAIGWAADVDQAACRAGMMLDTRINAASVSTTAAKIKENRHPGWICKRCAKIAVSRAAEATANMVAAAAEPATTTSTVTLPDGRVEARTGKGEWRFAVCSPGCHAGGWGVFRWSRTRQAAEKFQAWCNAQGGQVALIEAEVQ